MKKKPEKFHKKKPTDIPSQPEKRRELKFPSISRRLPEFKQILGFLLKPAFFMNFLAGFLVIAVILTGIGVKVHYDDLLKKQQSRDQVKKEYAYWKIVVNTHEGYRDGYFRLATLAYRLGKTNEAKVYVKKALAIDPIFLPAETLDKKIGVGN